MSGGTWTLHLSNLHLKNSRFPTFQRRKKRRRREVKERKLTHLSHAAQGTAQTDFRALIIPLRKLPKGTRAGGQNKEIIGTLG